MLLSYYISNNVGDFRRLTKEQNWSAKGLLISVRDIFIVSKDRVNVYVGEIDTIITFTREGDLRILSVCINEDSVKILNSSVKVLEYLQEDSNKIKVDNVDIKRKASIFYNVMLDRSRSNNEIHYNMLIVELSKYLRNIDLCQSLSSKRRSNSV